VQTYDPNVETRTAISLEELKGHLDAPRAFWMMVPAGKITEDVFEDLLEIADEGDTIVDGGNSNFRDSQRRYRTAQKRGLNFVDAGVSGGIWGLEVGFCLMVGGDDEPVKRLEPIFEALAPEEGYAHVGTSGSGHFVKMVHNGIEYGLMQSYAEGFEIMDHAEYDLDLHAISGIWRNGSVVRSWLLELLHAAFERHGGKLEDVAPWVEDSGEGRWTILERGDDPRLEPEHTPDVLFSRAGPGDYVCLQAFVEPSEDADATLFDLARRAREETGCVVTSGYGPRYLHSTGQLHKGGPATGLFLQIVDDTGEELPIPGQPFGFGRLIRAQAAGDYAALKERGRRVARVRLEDL